MRVVMFYHSLVSDWNHGNAHFLRGVAAELAARGHQVDVYEPVDGWSRLNLTTQYGDDPIRDFERSFPGLRSRLWELDDLDLDQVLEGAGLVLVHEWNPPALVAALGKHRAAHGGYRLFFHDTHHRAVTDREAMAAFDLTHYDGALVVGEILRQRYIAEGWTERAWTWHEAADTRTFFPRAPQAHEGDVVWIGNWGDGERTEQLESFFIRPIEALSLSARAYGVRYPLEARQRLSEAGIAYGGWLANHRVPDTYAAYRLTLHIPRRPDVESLPGIPTIRVFEALASGIPLLSAPWDDVEGLFTPGEDFLQVRDGGEMRNALTWLLTDQDRARRLADHGRRTVLARHTCAHRVDELLGILRSLERATVEVAA